MTLEEKQKLIVALDRLIRSKTPGRARDLAGKLRISKSTFYRLLYYVRVELNAPVVFNEEENRYIYLEDGIIIFGFIPLRALDPEFLLKIDNL